MECKVLGALEVVHGGLPVRIHGGRSRALLAALLIARRRMVTADALAGAVWGGDLDHGLQALRVQVSRLRKDLGSESHRLVTDGPGYRLVLDDDAVDAYHFETLAARGRQLLQTDAEAAAELLGQALGLWRGAAWAEFADEPFAMPEAIRLEEARLAALETRLDANLRCGHAAAVAGELEGLVEAYPLRERFWALRMLGLYQSGRAADALRCYQTARNMMVEEIGLEPGPELRRLERAILDQDESLLAKSVPERSAAALRLMIVDDHPMWREAMRRTLEHKRVAQVVAEASTGAESVALAQETRPDLVLMDLHLPSLDGATATRQILDHRPETKVLILSSSDEEPDVLAAMKAGAHGYLLKNGTADEVADAVTRVAAGEAVFSPSLAGLILAELRGAPKDDRLTLTIRQREILHLLAQGCTYADIARSLQTEEATIREEVGLTLRTLHAGTPPAARAVRTLLFVDVVSSTDAAARLGDEPWRQLLDRYHTTVSDVSAAHGGRRISTVGDGALETFAEPTAAIVAAAEMVTAVRRLGIDVRVGVHTGECDMDDSDVSGLAVHIGARVAARAGAGEVLVSQTVHDLLLGSGAVLADRGVHTLKGVPGRWRLFALTVAP